MKLPTGKLDSDLLKRIVFDRITYRDDQVKVRPGIGEDCAVVDFGDWDCIMSTDPISSAVEDIGRLCIHITCNDVASNGVKPVGIMLAVMLPVGSTEEDVEHIMSQAAETAAELQVEIIGGHTEVTPAVNQPVIVSTAIGKAPAGTSQSGNEMAPGDYIMMTKSCGLEGAGIAATDYGQELLAGRDDTGGPTPGDGDKEAVAFAPEEIERARSFLDSVSVVAEGVAAGEVGTHGMHDITEGGILGAIWEMCQISDMGAEVWEDDIPIEPETRKICEFFGMDPLRLISSGSMVIIVPEDKKDEMTGAMERARVPVSVIGRVLPKEEGVYMVRRVQTCGAEGKGRIRVSIDPPRMDEVYKMIERK